MAIDDKRISGKRIVDPAPIVMPYDSEELIWLSPKNILVDKSGKRNYDQYLNGSPFASSGIDFLLAGEIEGLNKDTVQLTDIEKITYQPYYLPTGELQYRAVLKIRNSSKTKEDVVGIDARTANLEAKS